jgi:hypothetical protein
MNSDERSAYIDFKWKTLLWIIVFALLTLSCIAILKTAEAVNHNIRPQNSLSMYPDGSCYVYGDNQAYAELCAEISQKENKTMGE